MADFMLSSSEGLALPRRAFLSGGGTLAFLIGATGLTGVTTAVPAAAAEPLAPGIWVTIDGDGLTTIVFPMTEMGQGSFTALPMIVAVGADSRRLSIPTIGACFVTYFCQFFMSNYFDTVLQTCPHTWFDFAREGL